MYQSSFLKFSASQVCGSTVGHRTPPGGTNSIVHTFSDAELEKFSSLSSTSLIVHHGLETPKKGFILVHRHLEIFLIYMTPDLAKSGVSSRNFIRQITGDGSAKDFVYHGGYLYDQTLNYILNTFNGSTFRKDLPREKTYDDMVRNSKKGQSQILLGLRGSAVKQTHFVPSILDGINPLNPNEVLDYPLQTHVAIHMRVDREDLLSKRYLAETICRYYTDRKLIFNDVMHPLVSSSSS